MPRAEAQLPGQLEELHPASTAGPSAAAGYDREEAQDVLQVAYLKVIEGRARFDGASSFKTWLFAVIRRTAGERRRSRWTRALAFDRWFGAHVTAAPPPDPEQAACGSETARRLRLALGELPRRQREVVHLVFYQDLSVEEAARVTGLSAGSARTHYHRAKARLRALLETR